jgi:hypothetical protein
VNPSAQAIALYEGFHKEAPREIGVLPGSIMPREVVLLGEAKTVFYRSKKRDPLTYEKPKSAIDYYHPHEGGVNLYLADLRYAGRRYRVPAFIRNSDSFVRLGQCVGFEYWDGEDEERSVDGVTPYPELFATSRKRGAALLAIQDRKKVLAIAWGGRLRVEPRGIVY